MAVFIAENNSFFLLLLFVNTFWWFGEQTHPIVVVVFWVSVVAEHGTASVATSGRMGTRQQPKGFPVCQIILLENKAYRLSLRGSSFEKTTETSSVGEEIYPLLLCIGMSCSARKR